MSRSRRRKPSFGGRIGGTGAPGGRVGDQGVDRLALVGRERGDVGERRHLLVGAGLGDHHSAVGVADQGHRSRLGVDDLPGGGHVALQGERGVLHDGHGVAVGLQGLVHPLPSRTVHEASVQPLCVVQDQQHRLIAGQLRHQSDDGLSDRVLPRRPGLLEVQGRGEGGQIRRCRPAFGHRRQQLPQCAVAGLRPVLHTRRTQHPHPRGPGLPGDGGQQRRFADARLAEYHQRTAQTRNAGQEGAEQLQLGVAADQCVPRDTGGPRGGRGAIGAAVVHPHTPWRSSSAGNFRRLADRFGPARNAAQRKIGNSRTGYPGGHPSDAHSCDREGVSVDTLPSDQWALGWAVSARLRGTEDTLMRTS